MAPLGETPTLECRNGLALFLRRGMWGWCQSLVTVVDVSDKPPPVSRSVSITSDQKETAIQLFATIAMNYKQRRKI